MTPWTELDVALAHLLAQAQPLTRTEVVACEAAAGRVLAQAVVSALDVPPADNSAMDGYAVRLADWASPSAGSPLPALPVSQRVAAGDVPQPLQPGTLARIFTGATLPPGADAVQMQELAEPQADGTVRLLSLPRPGEWIRRQGEDIATGATVLPVGRRLSAFDLGLAASVGVPALQVVARPRVAVLCSGNELVAPGAVAPQALPAGQIFNSNRPVLLALLRALGCAVSDLGVAPDDLAQTQALLAEAARDHDLVLASGGMSVGEEDHMKAAVQALGELALWQIAMKPGKPFAFGRLRRGDGAGQAWFIGLPGNPVSSSVCSLLLVRPFVLALQGVTGEALAWPAQPLRADFAVPKAGKRREFLRVRRNPQGGLDLFAHQGSGVLTSLAWADGLVDLPAGQTVAPGDTVRYIALSDLG